MTPGAFDKYMAPLKKLPEPLQGTILKIWKAEMRSRLGSRRDAIRGRRRRVGHAGWFEELDPSTETSGRQRMSGR